MTKEQTERYRDQLRAMAARVGGTVAGLEDQIRTPTGGQTSGGLSNTPLHLGDVGTDVYSQELGTTLLENEAYLRNEILDALDRIARGAYGRCENCGTGIGTERLDALPYVRHCAPCAAKLQAGLVVNLNEGRPEGWLGGPGHETTNTAALPGAGAAGVNLESKPRDVHAAGTPGGGTAVGGLAGTNVGEGDPTDANLEAAMGSSEFDVEVATDAGEEEEPEAFSGPHGGAVGGTPANKRSRGGKIVGGAKPSDKTPTPKKPKRSTPKRSAPKAQKSTARKTQKKSPKKDARGKRP